MAANWKASMPTVAVPETKRANHPPTTLKFHNQRKYDPKLSKDKLAVLMKHRTALPISPLPLSAG